MRTRRNRDRAGSGGKRAADTETDIVVPVVSGVPVAVGGAEIVWCVVPGTAASHTPTRGRPGFGGKTRIEPAAPEDRMAQAPSLCIFRVRDPGAHLRFNLAESHRSCTPAIAKAAQPVPEAPDVFFRQAAAAIGMKDKTEKLRGIRRGRDECLAGMKPQAPAFEKAFDPASPIGEHHRIVVKQRKVIDIAHVWRTQDPGDEMIERVEIQVREELAGEVSNRQATAARKARRDRRS